MKLLLEEQLINPIMYSDVIPNKQAVSSMSCEYCYSCMLFVVCRLMEEIGQAALPGAG